MADIRIKDLTTTASTTAADDFFAADGTTNGTRKLSAYSPSFGGNATVGGNLTVSGTGALSTAGYAKFTGSAVGAAADVWAGPSGDGGLFLNVPSGESIFLGINNTPTATIAPSLATFTGVLKTTNTTASTSTSSGALVVGNGTSGGLGVGGAINAGGIIQAGSGSNILYLSGDTGSNAYLTTGASSTVTNVYIGSASGCSAPSVFQVNGATCFTVGSSDVTVASGKALKLGNAYAAGAPTATGYIVIKDSTGTSYKIPAVAL